jgi:hypothetical protein
MYGMSGRVGEFWWPMGMAGLFNVCLDGLVWIDWYGWIGMDGLIVWLVGFRD